MATKPIPAWHRMGTGIFGKDEGTLIEQEGFGIIGAWVNIEGSAYSLDLIEAAPKLLAACQTLCRVLESMNASNPEGLWLGSEYESARAAIAEATGGVH